MLDRQTWPHPRVVNLAQKMVTVKINVGRDSAAADKYQIEGTPTILFLNRKGQPIHRVVGFKPPADFVKDMQYALSRAK